MERLKWTQKDLNELKTLFGKYPLAVCAKLLNRPIGSVKGAVSNHNIRSGRNGRFQNGLTPWNTGMKGLCFSPETQFKPGSKPKNTLPEGAVTIRQDKSGLKYKYVKTASGMKLLQRHNWQLANGPIPERCIIRFIDCDTMNCNPDNLYVVTRSEHLKMNENRLKMGESMKSLYRRERIRKQYGLPAISGLQKQLVNY